jgi:hypothetical protein
LYTATSGAYKMNLTLLNKKIKPIIPRINCKRDLNTYAEKI